MSSTFSYICHSMSDKQASIIERLKQNWGIQSNLQIVIILLVFSITGSLAVFIAKPLLHFFSVDKESMTIWLYVPLRILVIFPTYQVLILIIGALFGQFTFFWNMEKKILSRIGFKRFLSK